MAAMSVMSAGVMRNSVWISCEQVALRVRRTDAGKQAFQLAARLAQRVLHQEMGDARMPRGPARGDRIEVAVARNPFAATRDHRGVTQHVAPAEPGEAQR